jgi:hypothetical protein
MVDGAVASNPNRVLASDSARTGPPDTAAAAGLAVANPMTSPIEQATRGQAIVRRNLMDVSPDLRARTRRTWTFPMCSERWALGIAAPEVSCGRRARLGRSDEGYLGRVTHSPIGSLLVVVPARDEAVLIGGALRALRCSADHTPPGVSVRIAVVCDSCHDGTVSIARATTAGDARFTVVEGCWGAAGAARRAGVDVLRRCVRPGESAWIATTDADCVVPPGWLAAHVAHAGAGFDAVAGIVELRSDEATGPGVSDVFARHYELGEASHPHVHGANLGVRLQAYDMVGGFPAVPTGEEHALWNALRRAGAPMCSSLALRVATSGRLAARAPEGFARWLRDRLHPEPADATDDAQRGGAMARLVAGQ